MGDIGGYLASVDNEHRERVESQRYFTEAIRSAHLEHRDQAACFISFDGESIEYAALLSRGRRVVTSKFSVKFSKFIALDHLRIEEIRATIGSEFRNDLVLPNAGAVLAVPDTMWLALMKTIKLLRPDVSGELEALENLARQHRQTQAARGYEVMAEEKDAIGLAVSIFGMKREEELTRWSQADDQPAPFIAGLNRVSLREDTMIQHDASVFGSDWAQFRQYQVGAVQFHRRSRGQSLTIMNVNRATVENTTGVDLLYYHHTYRSFVMVQYKRMVEGIYRPTDQTYQNETSRMRKFETNPLDLHIAEAEALCNYRLHAGAFYFKLCPSTVFTPQSSDLIEGMYLPFDYWEILERSPEARGRRGGVAITRQNMRRHFNNTLFIDLVQDGWIGSRLSKTDQLEKLIQESLEQDKSVVVAISA